MLHDIYVVMFAMATGFTLSGIISNLYQLMFPKTEGGLAKTAHIGVMVFAGPSVLFQSSYKAMREQLGSRGAFWLASAVSAYWSMVLGLIFLRVAFSI